MTAPLCSIVVPVFNSADCLPELVRRVGEHLGVAGIPYELVFVDDFSRDASWSVLRDLAGRDPAIRALALRKNFGQNSAIMAGLHAARGEFVVIMDDDLQHDPVFIPELLSRIAEGHDVVYATYALEHQRLWKNVGSALNGWLAEIVLKKPRALYLSPFKVLRRAVVTEVCKYDGPYPYIDGLLFRVTGRITQHRVEHRPRFSGSSTYTFWKSVRVWTYLATNFSVLPLRVATLLGLAVAAFGLALGAFFLVERLAHPEYPPGWASLIVSVLVFGGIQLTSIGIVGEYIGRAYLNLSRQPQFVVAESIGDTSSRSATG